MGSILKITEDLSKLEGSTLAYGHFSTIHPGHIRYLKNAKNKSDKLVVALIGDGNKESFPEFRYSQKERADALNLISIADKIICLEHRELDVLVDKLKPNYLILGKEFENSKETEIRSAITKQKLANRLIQFHAGDIQYTTTDLLLKTEKELSEKRKKEFFKSCEKQKIKESDLFNSIQKWGSSKLVVVGDIIVDQFSACDALGMSAEAPVLVVKELKIKDYLGGAAIVASHIKALGAECELISVVGEDEIAKFVEKELNIRGINNYLIPDSSRPTTFKKRYVVENQKLFRVSRVEDHVINKSIENKLLMQCEEAIKNADGIVISDFVYGVITKKVLKRLKDLSLKYKIPIFADIQCSSQLGSLLKFKNFSLLCPTEREARIAMQDKYSGLEALSSELIKNTKTARLIMKLSGEGFIAYDISDKRKVISQAFPALTVNPVDVSGAGDALLSVMALGIASSESMMTTAALASCIASIAVSQMGNNPISKKMLSEHLKILFS